MDQNVPDIMRYLDQVGTVGLAFMVTSLMKGWLITKREYDREIARSARLEERLDKALHLNDRVLDAQDRLTRKD